MNTLKANKCKTIIDQGGNNRKEEILNKTYLTAEDLQKLIPELKYGRALDIIKEVREEMEKKNYFIPICRKKLALTKLVRKKMGI